MIKIGLLAVMLVGIGGCAVDNTVRTTDPLKNVVIQEALIPMPSCPTQVNDIVYPIRPALAIDTLTEADTSDYKKVGQAYMRTIADLQAYASDLEDVAYGVKEICTSVNTVNNRK